MKKSYVKPQVFFESFQLSANIAGDCGANGIVKTFAKNACGVVFGNSAVFVSTVAGCTIHIDTPEEEKEYNYCYHVPNANDKLFSS